MRRDECEADATSDFNEPPGASHLGVLRPQVMYQQADQWWLGALVCIVALLSTPSLVEGSPGMRRNKAMFANVRCVPRGARFTLP